MKYIIERAFANDSNRGWVRSDSYNGVYPEAQAQAILDDNFMAYRKSPVHDRVSYRRHAAVTPLELRGALRILESARNYYVVNAALDKFKDDYRLGWNILIDAHLAVIRQLEAVEKS